MELKGSVRPLTESTTQLTCWIRGFELDVGDDGSAFERKHRFHDTRDSRRSFAVS